MFSSIKIALMLVVLAGAGGGFMYVKGLKADLATSEANNLKLEQSVESQKAVIQQMKADFEAILESNKKLNVLLQTFKKDLDDLDKRFNKGKRDVGKLAIDRTKAIERIINKGANNAKRCVELASGAEPTEEEIKATKKSEINPECPALANPNYVPYE